MELADLIHGVVGGRGLSLKKFEGWAIEVLTLILGSDKYLKGYFNFTVPLFLMAKVVFVHCTKKKHRKIIYKLESPITQPFKIFTDNMYYVFFFQKD